MKNLFLYLFGICILFFCAQCQSDTKSVTISQTEYNNLKGIKTVQEYPKDITIQDNNGTHNAYVIVIDGCEYISYALTTHIGLLTHKGNCKFCQQRREDIIEIQPGIKYIRLVNALGTTITKE